MATKKEEERDNRKKICIIILLLIFLLLYLLILSFGHLENHGILTPTGNVDIFEIGCRCCCKTVDEDGKPVVVPDTCYDEEPEKKPTDEDEPEEEPEEEIDLGDLIVYDDYKIWDNQELRIFENPAYEYTNLIAPGSFNSYAFVIRNNNDFDVVVNIHFVETNQKNINMRFKVKHEGEYLIGSETTYDTIKNKTIKNIEIPAQDYKSYILDWKWVDAKNDTIAGFAANAAEVNYKLQIIVSAK